MESPARDGSPENGIAIVLFFRLLGPRNEMARCCSYRVGSAIELRVGVDGEPALMVEEVASHSRALSLADEWRTMLSTMGFVEPEA